MSAALHAPELLVHRDVEDRRIVALAAAITPEFATVIGWSPEGGVVSFPSDHPTLGWKPCSVNGCRTVQSANGLCPACNRTWKRLDQPPMEEFIASARRTGRSIGTGVCTVPGCQRPWCSATTTLCMAHEKQHHKLGLLLEEFRRHPEVVARAGLGPCLVAACTRDRAGGRYCMGHANRWKRARHADPGLDERWFQRTASAIAEHNLVSLRGLGQRVVLEFVYGLQQRCAVGSKTRLHAVRPLLDRARLLQVESLRELPGEGMSVPARALRAELVKIIDRFETDPEIERVKDRWNLAAFGRAGSVQFGEISQGWLREATKAWALDALPRVRGDRANNTIQSQINGIAALSRSLHLQRGDHGVDPAVLGREDITAFCNRLAYLHGTGALSSCSWRRCCVRVQRLLVRMRSLGLTRAGQPLHGLAEEFALGREDIPDEPEAQQAGRDLPTEVIALLCSRLASLETRRCTEVRTAVELLIDTGRRPSEICSLKLDCLTRDQDGKPVLVYDNHKAFRLARRLPISEATAGVIQTQQQRVRARFPDTPAEGLPLLPAAVRNPHGRRAMSERWLTTQHRRWVDSLPELIAPAVVEVEGRTVTRSLPFDKTRIFPYAYRHTYAQRHADAGVPVDVLCDLMDHKELTTTQGYYRVGEQRRREATDRVTTMQFDRHGNRIWRHAASLLDSERARRAIGEVAVPYGVCTEPSNVAAGGQDCPVRFRCVGCGHFRTDVSYLPDLEAYLADLLRTRERLLASIEADEWAKAQAMPSEEEIRRVRTLIARVKTDLDQLSASEHAQIQHAVTTVRRARHGVVGLGLPRTRPPLPDIRPKATP